MNNANTKACCTDFPLIIKCDLDDRTPREDGLTDLQFLREIQANWRRNGSPNYLCTSRINGDEPSSSVFLVLRHEIESTIKWLVANNLQVASN